MLVSHTHKFIYLKAAKTAGTSVEIYFERFCRPDPENISPICEELISDVGIVGTRTGDEAKKQAATYFNHMPARALRNALGPDIWDSYLKFCTIRNPYDQVVSLFWMCIYYEKRKIIFNKNDNTLCNYFKNWVFNDKLPNRYTRSKNDSREVYCIDSELVVDYLIFYENLESGVEKICANIGEKFDILEKYKTKFRSNKLHFSKYYDRECAEKVQADYDFEFDRFGYDRSSWKG